MVKVLTFHMYVFAGVWSNIFSLNVMDVWNAYNSLNQFWKWPSSGKKQRGSKSALCHFFDFNGNSSTKRERGIKYFLEQRVYRGDDCKV